MSARSLAIAIAVVAAPATFFAHALTYTLVSGSLTEGRHGYILPTLHALVTVVAAIALLLVARAFVVPPLRKRPPALSSVPFMGLWASFAATQCALFVSVESLEGYRVDLFGCVMQCAVALFAALLVICFDVALERCEEMALTFGTYLPRRIYRRSASPYASLRPVLGGRLNESRGVRRFQRPPPDR